MSRLFEARKPSRGFCSVEGCTKPKQVRVHVRAEELNEKGQPTKGSRSITRGHGYCEEHAETLFELLLTQLQGFH